MKFYNLCGRITKEMADTLVQNCDQKQQENSQTSELCVTVDSKIAHSFRKWLKEHNFEDSGRLSCKISSTVVAIPVTKLFINEVLQDKASEERYTVNNFSFELLRTNLPLKTKSTTSSNGIVNLIKELTSLKHPIFKWNEALIKDLPSSWEKHGDLLMLPENCFLLQDWGSLGEELWPIVASAFHSVRVAKHGHIMNNNFRSPTVTLLLGTSSWVEHVDNRIRYRYDISKCMFSAGNITEKIRIGCFDCRGETVVDLFSGIGYFTLPYLVHANANLVYACEWNPDAVKALRINLALNGMTNRCIVLEGDNQMTCPKNVADRVNLGLIPSSEGSWEIACAALKLDTGGMLHVHGNVTSKIQGTKCTTLPQQLNTHPASASPIHTPRDTFKLEEDVHDCNKLLVNAYSKIDEHSNGEELKPTTDLKSLSQTMQIKRSKKVKLREKSQKHLKPEWTDWTSYVSQKMKAILQTQTLKDWTVTVVHIEHVKSYAPHIDHLVADVLCVPNLQNSVR